uniref:FIG01363442: possible membrane protein n=1 Tax=Nonomuraea gerenzanensis TaxID=93944 RepID=A0A1M4E5R5_9ACTN|nr:FIG01363442: possible membrane protein [Nonomuraea gerenzanensis]
MTNYDGLLVSVLTEAQTPAPTSRRKAGPCALRGFKGADVVESEGVRLAAAVSLLLAAGKVNDHVADGDGMYARRPLAAGATRLAGRWSSAGTATAATLGLDPTPLTTAAARQALLERIPAQRSPGSGAAPGLRELTGPTEDAVAAAFAHTGVLAGKPHNREALEAAGRGFGRLAHLIDAVEDLADDRASGAYNPLAATGTGLEEARRHCDAAHADLRAAVNALDLPRPALTRALLVRETGNAVSRAFAIAGSQTAAGTHAPGHPPGDPGAPPGRRPPKRDPGGLLSMVCAALTCCTCGLYRPAWDEDREGSCCERFDCSGYECCGNCGNCCSCCSGEDGGCGCDGCSCGCD